MNQYFANADAEAPPVKHTALGRFKHEGTTIRLTPDGHAVAYMGDDERFEYVYKFVSDGVMKDGNSRRAREHNRCLLTSGTLYVARFTGNSPAAEVEGGGALPADRTSSRTRTAPRSTSRSPTTPTAATEAQRAPRPPTSPTPATRTAM